MTQPWKIASALQAIALLALASCASPNPDIYTLQAVPGATITAPPQTIEVRRPGLAGYLDRADIVLHDTGTQLTVNGEQRWAEPIGDMIGRVLTEDLSQRLPNSTVFSESGAITADPTLRVEIDIQHFDQGPDGQVTLIAQTAIEAGRTHTPLKTRHITLQTTPTAPGAAALAGSLSTLLGQLADLMAQDVGAGA